MPDKRKKATDPNMAADLPAADTPLGEDALYSSAEVAKMLRCTPQTLAHWRLNGRGPRYVSHSRNYVFYRLGDVRDFIRAGLTPGRSGRGDAE